MRRYDNQVVLITGAAGALGREFARHFVQRGAHVGLLDLDSHTLDQQAVELRTLNRPGKIEFVAADLTQRIAAREALLQLEACLGPTDIIIANAGIAVSNPIKTFDAGIFAKQVEINLIGMAHTLEPLLAGMMDRRRGHIVALSSLASYRGLPHMAGYCASKAGVSAFLDSLRVELQPFGILCTTICPSYIRSGMNTSLGVPTPGIITAEDAVNRIMNVIDKRRPYYAFPFTNYALLMLGRLLPTWLGDVLTRMKMGKLLK
jgi:short-subunit dehydrogenase